MVTGAPAGPGVVHLIVGQDKTIDGEIALFCGLAHLGYELFILGLVAILQLYGMNDAEPKLSEFQKPRMFSVCPVRVLLESLQNREGKK